MATEEHAELFEAVRDSDSNRLDQLLKKRNAQDVRTAKQGGSNLLHLAVGSVECLELLLNVGVDIKEKDKAGLSSLHLVVRGDYSESLLKLIRHGVDIRQRTMTGRTALDLAIESDAKSCEDILLLFGAQPVDQLGKDKMECQRTIRHGYNEGKICCGCAVVTRTFVDVMSLNKNDERVGISISSKSADFEIFLRRLPVEFQSSSVHVKEVESKDGEMFVTDIYQYRVNSDVKCDAKLKIIIPEGTILTKYQEYKVRQSYNGQTKHTENMKVERQGDMVLIKDLQLHAHGNNPMVGLGIIVKNKVQRTVLDPTKEHTIKSEVNAKFQVTVPPGGLGSSTTVEMEVMDATKSIEVPKSGESGSHSDFCTLRDGSDEVRMVHGGSKGVTLQNGSDEVRMEDGDSENGRNLSVNGTKQTRPKLTLKLPVPIKKSQDESYFTLRCKEDDSGNVPDNWDINENATLDTSLSTMTVPNGEKGSYIVVAVRKVGYWLKVFVRTLYESAVGTKVECVLFAAIKPRPETNFIVLVILSDCEHKKENVDKYIKQGYVVLSDMEHAVIINKKLTYWLRLECTTAKVLPKDRPQDRLPVTYQGSEAKVSTFRIAGDHLAEGTVSVFKNKIPEDLEKSRNRLKGTFPVYFDEGVDRSIPADQFPSDQFLDRISKNLGDEFYEIGIRLGNSMDILAAFDSANPLKRNKKILMLWRNEYTRDKTSALNRLFTALTKSQRWDLKRICEEEINKILQHSNDTELQEWIDRYTTSGTAQASLPDSPIDENGPFLFSVVEKLPIDRLIFIDMGLSDNRLNDMWERHCPRRWKIFQLLVKLSREEPSRIKFLKKLMKALKEKAYNDSVLQIKDMVRHWLDVEGHSIDAKQRKEIQKIIK